MTLPPVAPELAARLANYLIDDRARAILQELAPVLEPHLGTAVDQVIAGAARLNQVADTYRKHGGEFRRTEIAQYQELLKADFGAHYLDRCRDTIEKEAVLGFEGRARMNSAAALLRTAIAVLRRRHRLSPAKLATRIDVLSQAIFFDLATTSTFFLQRVRDAASARRQVIDQAIGEFDGAIGSVIDALKEATGSLTATSSTVQRVTEDTLRRMASASSASAETSQSVDLTVVHHAASRCAFSASSNRCVMSASFSSSAGSGSSSGSSGGGNAGVFGANGSACASRLDKAAKL